MSAETTGLQIWARLSVEKMMLSPVSAPESWSGSGTLGTGLVAPWVVVENVSTTAVKPIVSPAGWMVSDSNVELFEVSLRAGDAVCSVIVALLEIR